MHIWGSQNYGRFTAFTSYVTPVCDSISEVFVWGEILYRWLLSMLTSSWEKARVVFLVFCS
jgi:hypothetical protein